MQTALRKVLSVWRSRINASAFAHAFKILKSHHGVIIVWLGLKNNYFPLVEIFRLSESNHPNAELVICYREPGKSFSAAENTVDAF